MKAVLVFDIEEKIFKELEKPNDLDICFKWDQDIRYVSKKKLYVPKEKHIKNYSLKPLPENDHYNFCHDPGDDYEYGYVDGYGDCLKDITGEE